MPGDGGGVESGFIEFVEIGGEELQFDFSDRLGAVDLVPVEKSSEIPFVGEDCVLRHTAFGFEIIQKGVVMSREVFSGDFSEF